MVILMSNRTNLNILLLAAAALLGILSTPATADTIYVDASALPGGDGTTWPTAYRFLQDGLSAAGDGDQIWVATGTYYPTSDYGLGIGERGKHFRMKNSVAIYGGFPSGGGVWADRDPKANETILSGDLSSNDDTTGNGENSYHVVNGSGTDETAILDGFTITGGNADGSGYDSYGGGIYNESSNLIVINCNFIDNSADDFGGGMFNYESSPTVTNCMFTENSANSGGGMCNYDESSPIVTNCTFIGNSAGNKYGTGYGGGGGGMYNKGSPSKLKGSDTFYE
jgi:hypothetical protein